MSDNPLSPGSPGSRPSRVPASVPLFLASLAAWRAANDPGASRSLPEAVLDAVVKLSVRTIDDARTGHTLGTEREGTGIVIDPGSRSGIRAGHPGVDVDVDAEAEADAGLLILTIGYLVIEAQSVLVITRDNRILPATVIGFDHATGFGLLRASGRVSANPLPLGDSSSVREMQPLFFVAHESAGGASAASVVSRRPFVGYWEYMLAEALFTVPGRSDHSGATRDWRVIGCSPAELTA